MNTIIDYSETGINTLISRRVIATFICIMSYLYIYIINYRRVNAEFKKKQEEENKKVFVTGEEKEEEKEKEQEKEEEKEEEEEKEVLSLIQPVVEERDINTWYTFEDKKARYKGEWKNGLPNGKGIKHIFKDDSYIYGNFVDGFAEGYGKQTFEQTWEKTQPYYEGEFNRNNYDGKGEYHYGDGDYYKGMWKHNKYHGQGAAYSKRLDRTWVGEYENDVKGEGNWVRGEI
jgi:hypothetical protein